MCLALYTHLPTWLRGDCTSSDHTASIASLSCGSVAFACISAILGTGCSACHEASAKYDASDSASDTRGISKPAACDWGRDWLVSWVLLVGLFCGCVSGAGWVGLGFVRGWRVRAGLGGCGCALAAVRVRRVALCLMDIHIYTHTDPHTHAHRHTDGLSCLPADMPVRVYDTHLLLHMTKRTGENSGLAGVLAKARARTCVCVCVCVCVCSLTSYRHHNRFNTPQSSSTMTSVRPTTCMSRDMALRSPVWEGSLPNCNERHKARTHKLTACGKRAATESCDKQCFNRLASQSAVCMVCVCVCVCTCGSARQSIHT